MELQKTSWDCFVITLQQSSERYQNFKQNNSHLNIEIFKAVLPQTSSSSQDSTLKECLDATQATEHYGEEL